MRTALNPYGFPGGVVDPVNLADPVWGTLHIASYLNQSPDSVLRLVNSNGFPTPLGNQKRNRRWLAEDVLAFFKKRSLGELTTPKKLVIDSSATPKNLHFKNKRER